MILQQGDVLFKKIKNIEKNIIRDESGIIMHGEKTGNIHAISAQGKLFRTEDGDIYAIVNDGECAEISHNTHRSIFLPGGIWKIEQKRVRDHFSETNMRLID